MRYAFLVSAVLATGAGGCLLGADDEPESAAAEVPSPPPSHEGHDPPPSPPATPDLRCEYIGCRRGAPLFSCDWSPGIGPSPTFYRLSVKRGNVGAFQQLYQGPDTSYLYTGAPGRGDLLRLWACNPQGCSLPDDEPVRSRCVPVP